jgi:hypothetical protein
MTAALFINSQAAFFVFEIAVGLYFPSIGTLRSKYVPVRPATTPHFPQKKLKKKSRPKKSASFAQICAKHDPTSIPAAHPYILLKKVPHPPKEKERVSTTSFSFSSSSSPPPPLFCDSFLSSFPLLPSLFRTRTRARF